MKQQSERVESERSEIVQKLEEEQTKANDLSSSSISANHLAQKLERELASKQTQIRSLERMVQAEKEKSQESEEKLRTF
jgi:malate synthase